MAHRRGHLGAGGGAVGDAGLERHDTVPADGAADGRLHDVRRRAGGGLDRRQADGPHRRRAGGGRGRAGRRACPTASASATRCSLAGATGRLQAFDFRFDLTERYTFWSGTIAAFFLFCSYFGTDQSQVQRYLTAKSVDEARTSLLMSAYWKIPLQALVLLVGVLMFVFYVFTPPPMLFNRAHEPRCAASGRAGGVRGAEAPLPGGARRTARGRRQLRPRAAGRRRRPRRSSTAFLAADAEMQGRPRRGRRRRQGR